MGIDRKIDRKKEKTKERDLANPIDELSSIIKDAMPVYDMAKEQSTNIKSLITVLKDKGAPEDTTALLTNITNAIDKELADIREAQISVDGLKAESRNQEEQFVTESTAINKAAIVMQSILNLHTMMSDLERVKNNSLNPTTGDDI